MVRTLAGRDDGTCLHGERRGFQDQLEAGPEIFDFINALLGWNGTAGLRMHLQLKMLLLLKELRACCFSLSMSVSRSTACRHNYMMVTHAQRLPCCADLHSLTASLQAGHVHLRKLTASVAKQKHQSQAGKMRGMPTVHDSSIVQKYTRQDKYVHASQCGRHSDFHCPHGQQQPHSPASHRQC